MILPKLEKGGTPTFLDTKFGNNVIQALQDLYQLQVLPLGGGKLSAEGGQVILDLSTLADTIQTQIQNSPPSSNTVGNGDSTDLSAIKMKINQIIAALNGMTVAATCDPIEGSITVFISVNVPPPF